jgi:hypothetical protein
MNKMTKMTTFKDICEQIIYIYIYAPSKLEVGGRKPVYFELQPGVKLDNQIKEKNQAAQRGELEDALSVSVAQEEEKGPDHELRDEEKKEYQSRDLSRSRGADQEQYICGTTAFTRYLQGLPAMETLAKAMQSL